MWPFSRSGDGFSASCSRDRIWPLQLQAWPHPCHFVFVPLLIALHCSLLLFEFVGVRVRIFLVRPIDDKSGSSRSTGFPSHEHDDSPLTYGQMNNPKG